MNELIPLDQARKQQRQQQRRQEQTKANGAAQPNGGDLVLDRKDPLRTARIFVQAHHQTASARTLHHHRGDFYSWSGSHYREVSDAEIRAQMYAVLENAVCATKDGTEPFRPNTSRVNEALDALRAVTIPRRRRAASPDEQRPSCSVEVSIPGRTRRSANASSVASVGRSAPWLERRSVSAAWWRAAQPAR